MCGNQCSSHKQGLMLCNPVELGYFSPSSASAWHNISLMLQIMQKLIEEKGNKGTRSDDILNNRVLSDYYVLTALGIFLSRALTVLYREVN